MLCSTYLVSFQLRKKSKPQHGLESPGPLPPKPQLPPNFLWITLLRPHWQPCGCSEKPTTIPSDLCSLFCLYLQDSGATLHILPHCFLISFRLLFKGLAFTPYSNHTLLTSLSNLIVFCIVLSSLVIKYLYIAYFYNKIGFMQGKIMLFLDSHT